MQIRPYLAFKGECQEAIEFYQDAFSKSIKNHEVFRYASKWR